MRSLKLPLGLGLLAIVAVTAAALLRPSTQPATAVSSGPEMVLSVKNGDCDDPTRPTTCNVPASVPFTLSVDALGIPAGGYVRAQAWVDYGNDLTYKPQAAASEVRWPDCEPATAQNGTSTAKGSNHHRNDCATGFGPPLPVSSYEGALYEMDFTCNDAGATQVDLLPLGANPAGTSGAAFTEPPDTPVVPKVGSLTIECVTENPVMRDQVMAVIGASGGSLSTGLGDEVEVELDVPPGALAGDTKIWIETWVSWYFEVPPGNGELLSLALVFYPIGLTFDIPATATITYLDSEVVGINESELEVGVYDHATGEWESAIVLNRDKANNTISIQMDHFSHRTISRDHDGDGCADQRENQVAVGSETGGGLRDAFKPWDYYDVAGAGGGPPDQIVDLSNDILGVIQHYAPTGAPPYDAQFDRGPSAGPDPWNMTAPDGVIDLANDILGVITQYLHDCN